MWFLIGFVSGAAAMAAVVLVTIIWVDQQLGNFR